MFSNIVSFSIALDKLSYATSRKAAGSRPDEMNF
jgi:hypothetical protein